MMNVKPLIMLPLFLIMSNCKTKTATAQAENQTGNTISIELGKTKTIPGSKLSLQFKEVVEESRCPVDVTCVWEGIAIVDIAATSGSEKADLQIATRDFEQKNVKKSASFAGYRVTLVELKPQPGAKEEPVTAIFKYEKEK